MIDCASDTIESVYSLVVGRIKFHNHALQLFIMSSHSCAKVARIKRKDFMEYTFFSFAFRDVSSENDKSPFPEIYV